MDVAEEQRKKTHDYNAACGTPLSRLRNLEIGAAVASHVIAVVLELVALISFIYNSRL